MVWQWLGAQIQPAEPIHATPQNSLSLSFSSKEDAYGYLGNLQPQGGGSFYKAYSLAKNEFQNLPNETIRTLIYITGSSDTCESEDEWTAIQHLMSIEDSSFGIYSQIVILDDDGIKSRTLAEQFNSLSNENINADAPQSISEIQSGGVTVIQIVNNATTYVKNVIASQPTDIPTRAPTSTKTAIPKPGDTVVVSPTTIVLPIKTFTPTSTKTWTPTVTRSVTPSPLPPPFGIISPGNVSLGCQLNEDCMIPVTVQWISDTQAAAQGLYLSVWVKPYPGDSNIYSIHKHRLPIWGITCGNPIPLLSGKRM